MEISIKTYCKALGETASVLHHAIQEKEGAKKADGIFPYLELFSAILTEKLGVNVEDLKEEIKILLASQLQGEDKGVN